MIKFNLFAPNAPFFYPLKISESLTVFYFFQGVEKGCVGNKWVKYGEEHHSFLREKNAGSMTGAEELFLFLQSKSLNLSLCS